MAANLTLATWNATGIMSSSSYLGSFLDKKQIHVVGLSEHWLSHSNMHFLQSVHRDYSGFGVPDKDLCTSNRMTGKGGVALMWQRSLTNDISILDIDSDRICGIRYRYNVNQFMFIIQVYAPCSNHSISVFREFIDYLQSIICLYAETGICIVMGDFNAHLQGYRSLKPTNARGRYLQDMLNYHNLVAINTLPLCLGADSSFVSYGNLHSSLIDHILLPETSLDIILSCEIADDHVLNVSRHRPVACHLKYPVGINSQNSKLCANAHIKWRNIDDHTLQMYRSGIDNLLSVDKHTDLLDAKTRISERYSHIVNSIKTISDTCLPKSRYRHFLKPYWDQNMKDLHAGMRQARRLWIAEGRPRGSTFVTYRNYKRSKAIFRSYHRKCAQNYLFELNNEIDKAAEIDSAYFWKKINYRRKLSISHAGNEIEFNGRIRRDPEDIANGWGDYFQQLYSDTERQHFDSSFKEEVDERVEHIRQELLACQDRDSFVITAEHVVSLSIDDQMRKLAVYRQACMELMARPRDVDGVYCNVTWDNVMCWDLTPAGDVARQKCPGYVNGLSRSGYATRECLSDGSWKPNLAHNATDGWTNYSQCIGRDPPPDISGHLVRIELMSEIGYGISLASLILAVIIMLLSKRLHCKSNSLHLNLFIAFILRASVTFLKSILFVEDVGLEKDVIRKPNGKVEFIKEGLHWECKLLVTIYVYTIAASMMWIFMEGLYLHMLVYRTLFTERHGIRLYVLLGWVSPLVYLIPWVLVRIYFENDLCWTLNKKDGLVWIIRGPIIVTILINFIFFVDIVRVLCIRVKTHRNIHGSSQQLRKLAKFALVLIPLFGVIYIGFAAYPAGLSIQADIVYLYCEMFYNSIQGFILALLFCFLNEEVHNEIRRCWYKRKSDGFATRTLILSSWRKDWSRASASQHNHVTELNTDNMGCHSTGKNDKKRAVVYKARFVNRKSDQGLKNDYKTIAEEDM